MYRIQRVTLTPEIKGELDELDRRCLPEDDPYPKGSKSQTWWVVRDTAHHGRIVGFAGSIYWAPDKSVFLCRAGVLPEARGHGLQRRLIRVRVAHAKQRGAAGVYTYTTTCNCPSANNLIACGFRLWVPSWYFGGSDKVYWWKGL